MDCVKVDVAIPETRRMADMTPTILRETGQRGERPGFDLLELTYLPLVVTSSFKLPHGPRLASSNMRKSARGRGDLLYQFHLY